MFNSLTLNEGHAIINLAHSATLRVNLGIMEGKTREEVEKSGMIDTWLRKHRLIYTGATRHPLILSIRDGTVVLSAYKRWLVLNTLITIFIFYFFVFYFLL
jgi:hypothetical protein